jgi:hypothetical protein
MIQVLPESEGNLLGFKISGKLTEEEYKETLIPRIEEAAKHHGDVRCLVYMDPSFTGWDIGALWDDARYGLKHKDDFEKLAVVGAAKWVEWGTRLSAHFVKGEVRTFAPEELPEAWLWVRN